ncbi:MAG TPA: aromatic amino acid lyase, partial [Arthrobacter sp.]
MTVTTHSPLTVTLGSSGVTPEEVVAVARHDAQVTISQEALDTVAKVRAHIDGLAHSEVPAYGISTGFGALANRHIPTELRTQLQKSLIRSHAAGMGPAV